jgi:DNA polymerase III subunit alpha
VNKRVLEALIRSGSCDGLGAGRAALMASLENAMRAGEQVARSSEAGQVDIFGIATRAGSDPHPAPVQRSVAASVPEWSESERLAGERATLGLYLTGHPIAPFERELKSLCTGRIGEYAAEQRPAAGEGMRWGEARSVTVAGLILEIRRRGMRVSFILDDRSGRMEVTMNEETHQRYRDLIVKDGLVQVEGALRFDEFSDAWRVNARAIVSLDVVRERLARLLVLEWPAAAGPALTERLAKLLEPHRGGACAVAIRYQGAAAGAVLRLGEEWKVKASRPLIDQLTAVFGAPRLSYTVATDSSSAASA